MNAGDVIFKFKGDTDEIKKTTSKLSSTLGSVAKTAGSAFVGMAAVAGTALVGITTKAVQMRGELEQQIGGTEAVFKEFASTVQDDAAKAFDKMGVSANDYMAYMNKMGSLMQGSGISTQKSMELSSQAMQRAADVASIMGISVDDAMTAIAGAAKGNFTMMDNLGVAMNATSLSAYALEKGLNKTYAQMSQGEKIQLAMQMFLEKSAYAAGNYAIQSNSSWNETTTKTYAKVYQDGNQRKVDVVVYNLGSQNITRFVYVVTKINADINKYDDNSNESMVACNGKEDECKVVVNITDQNKNKSIHSIDLTGFGKDIKIIVDDKTNTATPSDITAASQPP